MFRLVCFLQLFKTPLRSCPIGSTSFPLTQWPFIYFTVLNDAHRENIKYILYSMLKYKLILSLLLKFTYKTHEQNIFKIINLFLTNRMININIRNGRKLRKTKGFVSQRNDGKWVIYIVFSSYVSQRHITWVYLVSKLSECKFDIRNIHKIV